MSTAVPAADELDEIEKARRLSGLQYTQLSELTGIRYKRLWRYFKGDGPLNRAETQRLLDVLRESQQESA